MTELGIYELPSEVDAPGVVIVALPTITDEVNEFGPDRHCTLAYLGTKHQGHEFLLGSLQNTLKEIATQTTPFEASVSGSGHLGDEDAAVLILESDDLAALHEAIVCSPAVATLSAMSDDQYPTWIPHLTVGDNNTALENTELPEEITFDAIALWMGEEQFTFMLNKPVDIFNVDTDTVVVMASGLKGFNPSLHPRGADGRFIAKFGIVKWLKNGHWQYGKVEGINKNSNGKDIDITATPSDLDGKTTGEPSVVLKPGQVYTAPKKIAHLPLGVPAGQEPKPGSAVKKIGGQGGSNPGGLYQLPEEQIKEDGNIEIVAKKYYVKKAKSDEHGRNEELANTLYADAGVPVPAVDYNPADGNIYSPITVGKHDMSQRLAAKDTEWMDAVRKNFVVDAWLSNRDVFGLTNDNMLTDENGTAWRIDNGGAMLYRAMGGKKTDFSSKVGELDTMRTSAQGKQVYGKGMTKDQELDGAQRVLAISPGQIDDRVAQAGLPKSLADTLKARRKFIADYYGLPLPESIKPADTDQMSTSAPLVDPADISLGKGKNRNWFPMSLVEAGFIAQTGDKIAFPDDKQSTFGLDDDSNLLSNVAKQAQLLGWQQAYSPQETVLLHKTQQQNFPRPTNGITISALSVTGFKWQRGDRLQDTESGQQLAVLGTNNKTGAVLVQAVVPEGQDAPPPFLFDSWATNPTHKSFEVKRWDPPKVVAVPKPETEVPAEVKKVAPHPVPQPYMGVEDTSDAFDLSQLAPEVPSVPEGQAVEVSKKVKEDLVVPLPTGDGEPAKAKTTAVPGEKSMVLSDNTIAKPGNKVISKFGGEYVFVKPKGPYAVVTDPNSETPDKLLTKKASTLFQLPGAEKADTGELSKPTLASGGLPVLGMIAKAKDGHEGEITMISPDGKFVFITNAAGVKKRKSVGTVSAVSGPSAPQTLPAPEPEPEPEDWEKELLAAPTASGIGLSEYGEYKQLKDMPGLKPGDKISKGDGYWWVVDYIGPMEIDVISDDEDAMTTTFDKYGLNTYKVEPAVQAKQPKPDPAATPATGLPGGYVVKQGDRLAWTTAADGTKHYFIKLPGKQDKSWNAQSLWRKIDADGNLVEIDDVPTPIGAVTFKDASPKIKAGDMISQDGITWHRIEKTAFIHGQTKYFAKDMESGKPSEFNYNNGGSWAVVRANEAFPEDKFSPPPDESTLPTQPSNLPGGLAVGTVIEDNDTGTQYKVTGPMAVNQTFPAEIVDSGKAITLYGDSGYYTVVSSPEPTTEPVDTPGNFAADLSTPEGFGGLKPGDKLDIGGNSVTVAGYPMFQGSDAVVAAQDYNGELIPLYLSGFKFGDGVPITHQPGFDVGEALADDFNAVYENAWHTPDLAGVEGVNGNAGLSYLAIQAGLDPNADKWLAYDNATGTFWDLTDEDGSGIALKWDKDSKSWAPDPAQTLIASKQPALQNKIEPDPVAVQVYNWTASSGAKYTWTKQDSGLWTLPNNDDAYTDEEMEQFFGMTPDKVETAPFVPPGNPGGDPDVSFQGYHPNSSDKIISLHSSDGSTETYWVQKENSTEWKGILTDGQLNEAHPLQDKDVNNLLALDGWSKKEEYGYDSNLAELTDTLDSTVIKTDEWPGNYTADTDETIIKTQYGTWLTSSDGGQTWHEIDEDTGQVLNVTWTSADLNDLDYDTYQQGVPTPEEPATPADVNQTVQAIGGPPPAIQLDALGELPAGYALKQGKHVRTATYSVTGGATTYWESVTDKASFWKQILPDGTLGDKKVGTAKLPGWGSVEIFNGNLELVKDTEQGKLAPSGLPLSLTPHEPVDISTLPDPVQQFINDHPGTATLEVARKDQSAPNMYYLVMPDGMVAEYKAAKGYMVETNHSNTELVGAWDAKVKDGSAEKLTFKDVTPTNTPLPTPVADSTVEPAALDPAPATDLQPPPVKIPGTTDHPATPNGYQLQPGQKVKHDGTHWFVETDPEIYKMVNPGGTGLNSFEYDKIDFDDLKSTGTTVEEYQVPGQPDATPVDKTTTPDVVATPPTVFDGYSAGPGDTVVMVPAASAGGDAAYWVKPAGSYEWSLIHNGSLDPNMHTDDETIQWSLSDLGGSTVYGDLSATPPSVTPPAVVEPGALPKTTIDPDQWTMNGSPIPTSVVDELGDLGGIPEGYTLHVYPYLDGTGVAGKYNQSYGEGYLVNNAGQVYYLNTGGGLTPTTAMPSGVIEIKAKAPTVSPVAVNQAPQIIGWQDKSLPDPATMPLLDTDDKNSVVTVPDGGAWAIVDNGAGGQIWMHLKPGTYDFGQGEFIKADQLIGINVDGETTDGPVDYNGNLFKITSSTTAWVDPAILGQAGAPSATPPVSAPSAPAVSEKPKWPGEKKPSAEDIASWGGMLTKDGHIPTVGMYVKRGSMTGKILSVNQSKTKAVVLTSDGKKSLRQIDLLSVDAQENYQAYAPKSGPVDIPAGMPLAIDTMQDALEKTAKDGNFRGLLPGQDGIRNGEMVVSSAKTPSGKKVNRVSFALTKEYRATLINMLSGKNEPVEKGDWASMGKPSQDVAVGDQLSMRISSIKMPDGTDQWKPDTSTKPPTHKVISVGQPDASNDGKFAVVMESVDDPSTQITAYFLPDKSISTYTWDPNKPKPKPPAGSLTLSAAATAQGWKLTNPSNDAIISAVKGGAHGEGTLDVEPGKVVPISSGAFTGGATGDAGYRPGGLRLVDPNGTVIEITSMDQGNNSFKGNVVITLPAGAKAETLNAALDKMGLAHKPLTQQKAKENLLPLLRGMLDFDRSDIDTAKSYSAEQLFAKMGQQVEINDIGWHDVLVGVDESTGKTSYFWSDRVRKAYTKKSDLKLAYRASSDGSPESIVSHVLYGTANATTKRTTGMIYPPSGVGTGSSPGSDAGHNAGHGGFMSASSSGVFHQNNAQASYVTANMMVFTRPENIFGRIMDYRAHKSGDAFGNPGTGANNVKTMLGSTIKDFQMNGGLPSEATGLIAVNSKAHRDKAIADLKKMGITEVNGIPLENYVVLKTSLGSKGVDDLPPFYLPSNARPIMDLPVSYGMAAAA